MALRDQHNITLGALVPYYLKRAIAVQFQPEYQTHINKPTLCMVPYFYANEKLIMI